MLVKKRWLNGYGYSKKTQFKMYNAIQKYGWENIKHEILFENLTKEEAEEKEIELIAQYKSNQIQFGYNTENGGNSVGKLSQETREKISNKLKGKPTWNKGKKMGKMKAETREKLRQAHLGKKIPYETREKIRQAHLGKKVAKETIDEMLQTKIKKGICYATKEERKQARNLHTKNWKEKNKKYMQEYQKNYYNKHYVRKTPIGTKRILSEEHKRKLSISHFNKNTRKVDCFKNSIYINTFESITIASNITGADIGGITKCCQGKQKTANGYVFKYHNE